MQHNSEIACSIKLKQLGVSKKQPLLQSDSEWFQSAEFNEAVEQGDAGLSVSELFEGSSAEACVSRSIKQDAYIPLSDSKQEAQISNASIASLNKLFKAAKQEFDRTQTGAFSFSFFKSAHKQLFEQATKMFGPEASSIGTLNEESLTLLKILAKSASTLSLQYFAMVGGNESVRGRMLQNLSVAIEECSVGLSTTPSETVCGV